MSQDMKCTSATPEQRAAGKPWVIAFIGSWIVALLLCVGLLIFLALSASYRPLIGSLLIFVMMARRIATEFCLWRLQRIVGQDMNVRQQTFGIGFFLKVAAMFGLMWVPWILR